MFLLGTHLVLAYLIYQVVSTMRRGWIEPYPGFARMSRSDQPLAYWGGLFGIAFAGALVMVVAVLLDIAVATHTLQSFSRAAR